MPQGFHRYYNDALYAAFQPSRVDIELYGTSFWALSDTNGIDPYAIGFFPATEAFLCSQETFNWMIECYIPTEDESLVKLEKKQTLLIKVKGLGIPNSEEKTLSFAEYQLAAYLSTGMPGSEVERIYVLPANETIIEAVERTVQIAKNDLGIKLNSYYNTNPLTNWETYNEYYRVNGDLLDVAIYVE